MESRDGDEPTGVYSGPPVVHGAPPRRDTAGYTASDLPAVDTQITTLDLMDLGPGAALGEFRIEKKIGEGGMGTVFSAVHPMIAKRAAIKILKHQLCRDKKMIERFIDEARAVNQIGHPNIVDIFAFGEMPDGRRYLAMEWLRGETLRDQIRRGPMSITQMAKVIRPLARALEAAHDKQVIHRDLKPENVFLVEVPHDEPHVKLLDFGIAKLAGEKSRTDSDHQILGTPTYISPEQARDANDAGPMSDVYSLGAIAFELLTGRPPFQNKGTIEMVTAHLEEIPVPPSSLVPEIPDEIDRLLLEMLAKSPNERPSLSHIRSVLALVRDPIELEQRPHLITPRLPPKPIEELIANEVSPPERPTPTPAPGPAPRDRLKTDPGSVAIRFARKSEPSISVDVLFTGTIPVPEPTSGVVLADDAPVATTSRWLIVLVILLIGAAIGAIVHFAL